MKHVLIGLISAAAVGLAGCSGTSDPTPEPMPEPEATAVAETLTPTEVDIEDDAAEDDNRVVDLSTFDACLSLMEPLQEANLAMIKISEDATNDPQSAVDMWRALSNAFEKFGKAAANAEVAALSTAVGEDGHALTDAMEKIYVKNDLGAYSEFTEANDAFWKSYQKLLELCDTTK